MSFLKFQADSIFDGYQLTEDPLVLIAGQDGEVIDKVAPSDAGEDVQVLQGTLCPGFINCHCHLELSHLKGAIPEGTDLPLFLQSVMKQRHFSEEQKLAAIATAEASMIDNGIVAVGDICNTAATVTQKQKGNLWYHNFVETMGWVPAGASVRFDQALQVFLLFAAQYGIPVESNSIVPHAPYSVSPDLWQKIIHFPGNHLLTMHNQETQAENELFLHGTGAFLSFYNDLNIEHRHFAPSGKGSLASVLPYLLPNQSLILVHNVASSKEDIAAAKMLGKSNTIYWCLCPRANQYITRQMPDIPLLMQEGCHLVLGTDSLASNKELSILAEMQMIHRHFPLVSWSTLLRWATMNGAESLQLDKQLGSFDKGKTPGILLLSPDFTSVQRLR